MSRRKSNLSQSSSAARKSKLRRARESIDERLQRRSAARVRMSQARARESSAERSQRRSAARERSSQARARESSSRRYNRLNEQRQRAYFRRRNRILPHSNRSSIFYDPNIDYSQQDNVKIGAMDKICSKCNARKWSDETNGMCCAAGKIALPEIKEPPNSIDLHPKKHSRICYERTIGKGKSISQRFGKVNKERWSTSAVSSTLDIDGHSTADDISDEHVNDNISTIKLEVNPESQDNTNSLNEACLTEPASAFIKIEPPDSPPSSQNINLASTSNSIYHSIKEETIIVDEDFERQSTSQLSCDITRSPESPNSNLNIKMEPPDSPSHEDSTVSSSNIKDELLFEVKSEPYVEQTLTKSEVISRMQAISDQLDTLSKKRQRQELKISSNEDPTRLQLLHNLLDNLVTEQTDKQLEYEDLTNVLRQYN